jgi:hypothetical protein
MQQQQLVKAKKESEQKYLELLEQCERQRTYFENHYLANVKYEMLFVLIGIYLITFCRITLFFYDYFSEFIVFIIFLLPASFFIFWFVLNISHIIGLKEICKKHTNLIPQNDVRSIPLFLSLIHLSCIREKSKIPFYEALSILLYEFCDNNLQKRQVILSSKNQDCLRKLVQNYSLAHRYPDAIGGALAVLQTIGGEKNKAIITKIAKRAPKDKSDAWLPQAAQACLEKWDTSNPYE